MAMRMFRSWVLAFAALALAGLAAAQGEPTIQEIYSTAQSGQLDKARQMTQQVLRDHPKSAKAHFVMAELDARQGNATEARSELATAESLAPGLPFARPDAVQALRSSLGSQAAQRAPREAQAPARAVQREPQQAPSFPWSTVLIVACAAIVVAWVMRSRRAARADAEPAYAPAGYGPAPAPMGTAWGTQQPGYGSQPGYGPQPAQPGMGSRVMGGLATGLAVGAGALAAQEIGRRMLGEHGQQGLGSVGDAHAGGSAANSQLARDAGLDSAGGLGGAAPLPEDFGINDTASWDDGGGSFGGDDGGSWDS